MTKKPLTLLIAVTLLVLSATPAFADDGGQGKAELKTKTTVAIMERRTKGTVELKTRKTAAIVEGDTAWVAISWKAKKTDATNFKIVATTDVAGVTISYPDNTNPFSSLMGNDTLTANEIDFTSLLISVPYGISKVKLKVVATWTQDGRNKSKDYKVEVPVAKFKGDDVAQATADVGTLSGAAPDWIEVSWTGIAPILNEVQMTVSGPTGIVITYPQDRAFTSLWYDNILVAGETDFASAYIDASALSPGNYTLDVTLTYSKGGAITSVTGQVAIQITG